MDEELGAPMLEPLKTQQKQQQQSRKTKAES
jgi:hypothetical protein